MPPSHLAPDLGTPSTKPNTGSALPCSSPIPSWGVPTPAAQGCLCCPHHSPLCLGRCPALCCPACILAELAIKYLRVLIASCRRLGCCREVGGQRGWGWPSHYNRVNEPPSFVASFGGEAEQEPCSWLGASGSDAGWGHEHSHLQHDVCLSLQVQMGVQTLQMFLHS